MPRKNRQLQILEAKIVASRNRMTALWEARGYTDAEVLAAGIELDELLNEYERRR